MATASPQGEDQREQDVKSGVSLSGVSVCCSEGKTSPNFHPDFREGSLKSRDIWSDVGPFIERLDPKSPAYSKRSTRETWNYGYSFFHETPSGKPQYFAPPEALKTLGKEVVKQYHDYLPDQYTVDNYIISVYNEGHELLPHFDFGRNNAPHQNKYPYNKGIKFYYDDYILGLVIQPDSEGKLFWVHSPSTKAMPTDCAERVYTLKEEEGDTFCFGGALRFHPWYHGVSKVMNQRVSITFRATKFWDKPPG